MDYRRLQQYTMGLLIIIIFVSTVIEMDPELEKTQEIRYNIPYTPDMITSEEALNIALELPHGQEIWQIMLTLDTYPRLKMTDPTWSIMITYMPHSDGTSGDLMSMKIDALTGEILETTGGGYNISLH